MQQTGSSYLAEHVIDSGLVLEEVVDPGSVEQRPLRGWTTNRVRGYPCFFPSSSSLSNNADLPVLVEVPVLQVGILPDGG